MEMGLYKIAKRHIQISEHIYDVEANNEEDAMRNLTETDWDKVFPQEIRNTKHTEYTIEGIL